MIRNQNKKLKLNKMYKHNKQWIYAGLVLSTLGVGVEIAHAQNNNIIAHADGTTDSASQTSATTSYGSTNGSTAGRRAITNGSLSASTIEGGAATTVQANSPTARTHATATPPSDVKPVNVNESSTENASSIDSLHGSYTPPTYSTGSATGYIATPNNPASAATTPTASVTPISNTSSSSTPSAPSSAYTPYVPSSGSASNIPSLSSYGSYTFAKSNKTITRTIKYLNQVGSQVAADVTQSANFVQYQVYDNNKRLVGYSTDGFHPDIPVSSAGSIDGWLSTDNSLADVKSPLISGYQAPDKTDIASQLINPMDSNSVLDVYYSAIPSSVPSVASSGASVDTTNNYNTYNTYYNNRNEITNNNSVINQVPTVTSGNSSSLAQSNNPNYVTSLGTTNVTSSDSDNSSSNSSSVSSSGSGSVSQSSSSSSVQSSSSVNSSQSDSYTGSNSVNGNPLSPSRNVWTNTTANTPTTRVITETSGTPNNVSNGTSAVTPAYTAPVQTVTTAPTQWATSQLPQTGENNADIYAAVAAGLISISLATYLIARRRYQM